MKNWSDLFEPIHYNYEDAKKWAIKNKIERILIVCLYLQHCVKKCPKIQKT